MTGRHDPTTRSVSPCPRCGSINRHHSRQCQEHQPGGTDMTEITPENQSPEHVRERPRSAATATKATP
jgi:hypothetical protein